MTKGVEGFKRHAIRIINNEKRDMIQLTDEEIEYHNQQTICHIWRKPFDTNFKNYIKVAGHYDYTGATYNICNLR